VRVGIIGDVHGHATELAEMIGELEERGVDRIILLGDLVDRGPASKACLRIAMTWQFRARSGALRSLEVISGNHEDAYVRTRRRIPKPGRDRIPAPEDKKLYRQLTREELDWMEALPRYIVVHELDLFCVHGGVTPHMATPEIAGDYMLRTRYLDDHYYELSGTRMSDVFWAEIYDGRWGTIVFGHESHREVTQYEHAIGIDGEGFRRVHAVIVSNEKDDERLEPITVCYGDQARDSDTTFVPLRFHDALARQIRRERRAKRGRASRQLELWERYS